MRWKADRTPKKGDCRKRHKFAWTPTRIDEIIVWLERYGITEEYKETYAATGIGILEILDWVETERYTLDYYC